jgi:hypothetical protein
MRFVSSVIGKATRLEAERVFVAAMEPVIIFIGHQQDRHAIVNGSDRLVAVGHHAGIDRSK